MRNRYIKPLVLILVVFAAATVALERAKAQTLFPQTVSPLPTPSSTLSIEERLGQLESRVNDLSKGADMSQLKDTIDIFQSIVTVTAIGLSGWWSYWLFVKRRQRYPRANVSHGIKHIPVADGKHLVHVDTTVSNTGEILLSLVSLETRIQQVLPMTGETLESISKGLNPVPEGQTEIAWPTIDYQEPTWEEGECEIEPGESQVIPHDFILDNEVEIISVYSYVKNKRKRRREIGWDLTTLYDLRDTDEMSVRAKRSKANGRDANTKTEGAET